SFLIMSPSFVLSNELVETTTMTRRQGIGLANCERALSEPNISLSNVARFRRLSSEIGKYKSNFYNLADLLSDFSGVYEGYSIQIHNERLFEIYQAEKGPKLFALARRIGKTPKDFDNFIETVIVLHNIGKPIAMKVGDLTRHHEFTLPILLDVLGNLGWSDRDIQLAKSLVSHNVIGNYMKGNSDVYRTLAKLDHLATQNNMDLDIFTELQVFFYKIDAGSYPYLQNLFFVKSDKGMEFKSERIKLLMKLSRGKISARINSHEPDVSALSHQLTIHREKLFEELFMKLNFSSFEEFESRLFRQIKKVSDYFSQESLWRKRLMEVYRLEDLKEERVEIKIRTKYKYLESILNEGYKNKSNGGIGSLQNSFSGDLQDLIKASFLGLPPEDVAALPAEVLPAFGFLAPSPDAKTISGLEIIEGVVAKDRMPEQVSVHLHEIGDMNIVLDPQDYKEALSLFAGDSMSSLQDYVKARVPEQVKYNSPNGWDQIYVPWKYRMIFHKLIKNSNYNWSPRGWGWEFSLEGVPQLFTEEKKLSDLKRTFSISGLGPDPEYFEVQIWKPVKKIIAIEIGPKVELSEKLRALLKQKGIEIRQGKSHW
ncbi:MAG: hypothetical protein H6625_09885, partial [Bdellovibrionaceae bacterium]|nr:hypothetical protein [Pseudobdellovibrionaceae bacterium]